MRIVYNLSIVLALLIGLSCKEQPPKNSTAIVKSTAIQQPVISVVDVNTFEAGLVEGAQLIDVRTDREWESGHLKGAQHFQINNPRWEDQISTLDKNKPVYVYCAKGGRSARCAKQLKEAGFTQIIDLDGGITAWKAADKEIENK